MTMLLLTMTGCGNSDGISDVSTVETINLDTIVNEKDDALNDSAQQGSVAETENHTPQYNDEKQVGTDTQQNTDDQSDTASHNDEQGNASQPQSVSELDGTVESIGNNSIVINKTFYPSPNEAVSYGEDDKKVLVTVYFSDDTTFEVRNVRNSGVNGDSDVETQAGTFSDIKEQSSINMTGSYEGSDFYATQVIIYHYI